MRCSTERILTTHAGSLPRPPDLRDALLVRDRGEDIDIGLLEAKVAAAVDDVVKRQIDVGVDTVNDGEVSKLSYVFYLKGRVTGIGDSGAAAKRAKDTMIGLDMIDHPDFYERMRGQAQGPDQTYEFPACLGPLTYADVSPLRRDIANLMAVVDQEQRDVFMTAASPC
jgi:5-methyltetrahydropteroyltriglutamate--homocysteine methyltransferase